MYTMMGLRRGLHSQFALGTLCLVLGLSQGCARSEPLRQADTTSQASKQELPFHPDTGHASVGVPSGASADPGSASSLPFRAGSHSHTLPSGTLLTVQLQGLLSRAMVHTGDLHAGDPYAGDPFTATVTAPLTVDGETLIEPGASVTGLVEAEQSQAGRPGLVPGSGYFRLTLTAITVDGRQVVLHTSSLFAREGFRQTNASSRSSSPDLRPSSGVQKGRRLTFRLTAPITLDDPNSVANRQYLGSSTQ